MGGMPKLRGDCGYYCCTIRFHCDDRCAIKFHCDDMSSYQLMMLQWCSCALLGFNLTVLMLESIQSSAWPCIHVPPVKLDKHESEQRHGWLVSAVQTNTNLWPSLLRSMMGSICTVLAAVRSQYCYNGPDSPWRWSTVTHCFGVQWKNKNKGMRYPMPNCNVHHNDGVEGPNKLSGAKNKH